MGSASPRARRIAFWSATGFTIHTTLVLCVAMAVRRDTVRYPDEEVGLWWWAMIYLDMPSSIFGSVWYALFGSVIHDENWLAGSFFLIVGGIQYALLFGLAYAFMCKRRRSRSDGSGGCPAVMSNSRVGRVGDPTSGKPTDRIRGDGHDANDPK